MMTAAEAGPALDGNGAGMERTPSRTSRYSSGRDSPRLQRSSGGTWATPSNTDLRSYPSPRPEDNDVRRSWGTPLEAARRVSSGLEILDHQARATATATDDPGSSSASGFEGSGAPRPVLSTFQTSPSHRGDYFAIPPSGGGGSPSPLAHESFRNPSSTSLPHPTIVDPAAGPNGYSPSSSVSRASSARSTSSVQAVPLRTPLRSPARSPVISRAGSHVGPRPPLVPSFLFRTGSSSGTSAVGAGVPMTPAFLGTSTSGKSTPGNLSELGGARVPEALPETSREYTPSIASPTRTVMALPAHARPDALNPPHSTRGSLLYYSSGTSSSEAETEVAPVQSQSQPESGVSGSVRASEERPATASGLLSVARPDMPARTASSSSLAATRCSGDFNFGEILGEGSYSTVFHAVDKHPPYRQYAIKVLDKRHISKEKKVKYVAVERDTLNLLDRHPGCLRLYWTFQDANCLYYVLEYAAKGEILKAIKQYGSFSTDCARFYAAQILTAVEHMHSRGVIHRDLKPENILLDEHMRVKIADFGSAKILKDATEADEEESRAHSFVGTAEYVSPELLTDKVAFKSSDFWALGCVIFQFLAGHPPFKSRSEYLTFQKITNLDYEIPEAFPADAKDLMLKLLVLDPKQRLGAAKPPGIEAIKQHPFFQPIDWTTLWTMTPPPLQTGINPPAPRPAPSPSPSALNGLMMESEDDAPSEISSVNGGPRAEDAPAEVATGKPNGSSKPTMWFGTKKSSKSVEPSPGSGMTWVEMFLPNELLIYSGPVVQRRGLLHKKRTLIVTDYPRLLCVKEDKSTVRVKHEILFRPLPGDPPAAPQSSHHRLGTGRKEDNFPIFRSVTTENPKTFWVHTSSTKPLRFEDPNADAERWTAEINIAASRGKV